jgi:hypothetical protein
MDWKDEARDLREQGLSERAIAEAVGKAPSSVHQALAESNGHGDARELEREAGPAVGAMPTPGQQTIGGGEVQSVYVEQIRVDGTTQLAIDFGGKQAHTAKLTLGGSAEVDGFFRKGDRIRGTFEAVVVGRRREGQDRQADGDPDGGGADAHGSHHGSHGRLTGGGASVPPDTSRGGHGAAGGFHMLVLGPPPRRGYGERGYTSDLAGPDPAAAALRLCRTARTRSRRGCGAGAAPRLVLHGEFVECDDAGVRELTVGSLFSGIGGFDLGFERAGMRTVWFCEQDPFCQRVLGKHWPGVPVYPDVRALVADTGRERRCSRVGDGNGHGTLTAAQIGPTWRLGATDSCPCRCHTSTSSAAGSPARTSQSPAEAKGSTGHARVFGASTPDSFASYDPATSSWRTSQLSLLEEWSVFSGTWPRAGMTRSGTAFRLRPLAPLTGGTGSGLLPTPAETWGTPTARDWKDTGDMTNVPENGLLGRQVLNRESWPTPKASDSSRDPGQATRWGPGNSQRSNLKDALRYRQVTAGEPATGSLNPTWVSKLMGFPADWLDL